MSEKRFYGHFVNVCPMVSETPVTSTNWRGVTTPLSKEDLKRVPQISEDSRYHLVVWDEPPAEIRKRIDAEIQMACSVMRRLRKAKLIASCRQRVRKGKTGRPPGGVWGQVDECGLE